MHKHYAFILSFYTIVISTVNAQWVNVPTGNSNYLNAVHFVDDNVGYAAGDSPTLLKTTNGGTNWNSVAPSAVSGTIYDVLFTDANTGWILTGDAANGLMKTVTC